MSDNKDNAGHRAEKEAAAAENLNKNLGGVTEAISAYLKMMDGALSNLVPKNTTKVVDLKITPDTQRVIRKGFFGIGRKTEIIPGKTVKANVFMSMNNVMVIDIEDKTVLKEYYNSLQ